MAKVRTLLNFIVAGALLGTVATSLFWPRYLTWDNTPGAGKSLCDCADNTRQTAERLVHGQLIGGGTGSAFGLAGGIAFVVLRRRKKAAAPATAAPPAPPAPKA